MHALGVLATDIRKRFELKKDLLEDIQVDKELTPEQRKEIARSITLNRAYHR